MSHAQNKRERIQQLERSLLLAREPLTPTQLAKVIGCHRTTIHRYLNEMEIAYALIIDEKGRYRLDHSQYISNVRLNSGEALSIYLALRRFIRQTSKAPDFFISAIQKVALALRHPILTDHLAASSLALGERLTAAEQTAIWKVMIRGWYENIVVRLQYRKNRSHEITEHEFEPYLFEPAVLSHGVYVIGWSRTRNELRTFKLDRIQKANLTTARFTKPDDLEPDILLKHGWGVWYGEELTKVELRFAPAVALRVQETIWHPSQQYNLLSDGSLYWSVEIAGTKELISWIRGWGEEVEVLGPSQLRKEIADSLRRAADLYRE